LQEQAMRKVLRGYAKDKEGNLILIGTMPEQGQIVSKGT